MMKEILAVGIGGFIGSVIRFLLTKAIPGTIFPFATLAANVIAGFAIGAVIGLDGTVFAAPQKLRLFLTTGLLGGLSTFSTFSAETVTLFELGKHLSAGLNILLSLSLALLGVLAGRAIIKTIIGS
jgi:CrcB protein